MVHFIFMDHKNFDVYFICFFLWPASFNSSRYLLVFYILWLLLLLLLLFCFAQSYRPHLYSLLVHSISFTHTRIHFQYIYVSFLPFIPIIVIIIIAINSIDRSVSFALFRFGTARHGFLLTYSVCARCSFVFFLFDCILNETTPKKVSTVVQPN